MVTQPDLFAEPSGAISTAPARIALPRPEPERAPSGPTPAASAKTGPLARYGDRTMERVRDCRELARIARKSYSGDACIAAAESWEAEAREIEAELGVKTTHYLAPVSMADLLRDRDAACRDLQEASPDQKDEALTRLARAQRAIFDELSRALSAEAAGA